MIHSVYPSTPGSVDSGFQTGNEQEEKTGLFIGLCLSSIDKQQKGEMMKMNLLSLPP